MLAHAVEPHLLRELDVAFQRVVVRSGDARARPVPLIEHQAKRERPAVEQEPIALGRDRAQGGIALRFIEQLAAVGPELQPDRDQRR